MVHTAGTVIVLKDGRYYEVVDVTAQFPGTASDAQWNIVQKWQHDLDTPPTGEPATPDPGTTPSGTPTSSSTAGTSGSLAATGVSDDRLAAWTALSAGLLGAGALLVLMRRRSRTEG